MSRWLNKFSRQCIHYGIVSEDQLPWFIYGIEKRLSTVFTSIPFLLLAIILSTPYCAISMFMSFFLLRRRTSGYHANSAVSCILISLLLEAIFLASIYPLFNLILILAFLVLCIPLIFKLAPYRHPNMHFTDEEVSACQFSARVNTFILTICTVITYAVGLQEISKGLTIGIAMSTVLLCISYILEWRKHK